MTNSAVGPLLVRFKPTPVEVRTADDDEKKSERRTARQRQRQEYTTSPSLNGLGKWASTTNDNSNDKEDETTPSSQ